ncbi:MAG: response regulator [Actinomycetota bacterium]|nr:response regulator [Actinomycetota bacterium]
MNRLGSFSLDPDRKTVSLSTGMREILGIETVDGVADWELVRERFHPEDRAQTVAAIEAAAAGGEPLQQDVRILDPDGEVRLLELSAEAVPRAGGDGPLLCGTATEITEVRRRRQLILGELSRIASRDTPLDEIMQQAIEHVARVLRVDFTKVLELNSARTNFLLRAARGFDGELVGVARVAATPDTHAGYALQAGAAVVLEDLRTEERFTGSVLLQQHQVRSGIAVPISGGGVGLSAIYGVLTVHTREPRAFGPEDVDFLNSVATILASAIARERSARLQQQLNQSQRLESLGQLAGGIAHDFNNLLAVITNYAAFLSEALRDQPETVKDDLREIRKAAERAADLTRQLLVFSRREVVKPEVLDLNRAIEETQSLLRRTIGEDIDLCVELQPDLPKVTLGAGQIEQLLMNLSVNARDAMPTGGALTIRTETVFFERVLGMTTGDLEPGTFVQMTIVDTGRGMEPEVVAQIFEPFFTTKQEGRGTGLGLATVYGIVQERGGQVQVYSELGRGTAFKIYLPASEQTAAAEQLAQPVEAGGSGERVLVVEDEPAVRRLTVRILSGEGYEVIEAAEPYEALALCEDEDVDLLLTDLIMPGMSGKELADRLTASKPELRVLFMSGYTGDVITRQGMLSEDVLVLEKPFSSASLLRRVRASLDEG